LSGVACFCTAAAQPPVAAFSASVVKGCAPLVVQFTDESAGDPTGWTWDFGNGQLVKGQNQTITYIEPGKYSVTLVVRNAAGINSLTRSDLVVVASAPEVDFGVSQSLSCVNVPLQFNSVSAAPGQSLTSWNWDFGDGSTSSDPDPRHSYASPGAFTVKLTAATAGGCKSTVSRQNTVQVSGGVTAAFDFTIPATCKPPFVLKFQNKSQGSGNLNYTWTSSVGSNNAISPEISFPKPGEYPVQLLSMDNYGCSDTITKTVVLREISTEFLANPSCTGLPSTFVNISGEPPLSSIWQLDNETRYDRNLTYTFSSPGTHRVKLTNTYVGCQDSAVRTIRVVNNPQVRISMDRRVSCRIPATIHFRDNTAGATQWVWNFGDGTSSTARFPAKTYTAGGEYSVSITVTNSDGCTTSYIHPDPIILKAPSTTIVNAPGELCKGGFFSPVAQVSSIENITRYLWSFGDGGTSSRSRPSHKYVSSGNYPLSLSITTTSGCISTTKGEVNVGTPAAVDFNASSLQVCPLQPVSFNAAGNDPAIVYSWDFGNNIVVSGNEVVHNFTDTGRIRVVLTGRNNGCAVKTVKHIIVNPPIARFRASVDCNGSKTVSFANESIPDTSGEMRYTWDFGDPAIAPSNLFSPQIIFPRAGTFQVTLTASSPNTACTTSVTNRVTISSETVNLSASKSAVCRGEVFELTAEEGYGANSFNHYQWTIGDQFFNSDSKTIKVWVDRNGKFPISLRIIDVNGCIRDSTSDKMITVRGPVAAFNSPDIHCGDSATRFTDLSTIETSVANYAWNFGDGQVESYATSGITHHYENEGAYLASLVVTDQSQCSDSTQSYIVVSRPRAAFSNADSTWCPGAPVNFTDHSSGNISHWNWNFGDGGTSGLQHAEYRYGPNDGDYTVALTVTNDLGCMDSMVVEKAVQVRSPVAYFTMKDSASICLPFVTDFVFEGQRSTSWFWDAGDGSAVSGSKDLKHTYSRFGTFYPTLFVMGNGGCISTFSKKITVTNPALTAFTYSAPETCNKLNVDYSITPPAGTRFILNFGDGYSDSSQSARISHLYSAPAFYQPSLVLIDSSGCEYKLDGASEVRVIGAAPLFGKDGARFCDSGTVNFTNYTIGNDRVMDYHWDFGDGSRSAGENQVHHFAKAGTYTPMLTTTTRAGCRDSYTDTVRVYTSPRPQILSADTICLNSPVSFSTRFPKDDSTAVSYAWSFSDGLSSANEQPARKFGTAGTHVVKISATLMPGCNGSSSKPLFVKELPVVHPIPPLTLIGGQGLSIPTVYSGDVSSYHWSPSTGLSCNDCPNPVASPEINTQYRVTATDAVGCSTEGEVTVTVSCSESNFFIPNTFSPNNDGNNDRFYPRGSGLAMIRLLRIFNRWGELVFDKRDFPANSASAGWDGTIKGKPASSDVYVYQIEVICENGQLIPFKGNIMLMR